MIVKSHPLDSGGKPHVVTIVSSLPHNSMCFVFFYNMIYSKLFHQLYLSKVLLLLCVLNLGSLRGKHPPGG
jgi:hypothetical protein